MATAPDPSERVVEQRLRNRAIEALKTLAEGDDRVRSMGVGEYEEEFFDVIDDRSPGRWRTWSVFNADEVRALGVVHDLLVRACDETPQVPTPEGSSTTTTRTSSAPDGRCEYRQPRPQPLT
jgi:hypothetical protein